MKRVSLSNLLLIVCFGFLLNASVGKLKHQEECGKPNTLGRTFSNCNIGCFPYDGGCWSCSGCCKKLSVCLQNGWCYDYLKYVDDHHIKNERGIDIECFDKNSTSESPFTNPPLNIPKGGHPTDGHESKNIQIILSIAVVVFVLGLAVFFIIWRKQNALRLRYLSFRHRSSASTSSCSGIEMATMFDQNRNNEQVGTSAQNGHATRVHASNGTAGSVSMNGGMNVVNNQMSFRPCSEGVHRPSRNSVQTAAQKDPEQVVSGQNQVSLNGAAGPSISDNNLDQPDERNPLLPSANVDGKPTSSVPHTGNRPQGNKGESTGSHSSNRPSTSTDAGPVESVHYNRVQNGNLIGNRSESQPPSVLHTSNNDIRDAGIRLELENYGAQLKEEEDPPSQEISARESVPVENKSIP